MQTGVIEARCGFCTMPLQAVPAEQRVRVNANVEACGAVCAEILRTRAEDRRLTTRGVQGDLARLFGADAAMPTHGRAPRIR